jgi:hypothetical protein
MEYFQATCNLAPFSFTPTSFDTVSIHIVLHPKLNGYFLFFLENYKLNHDLKFFFIPSS